MKKILMDLFSRMHEILSFLGFILRITQNSRNCRKFVPQNFITLKYKISLKNTETGRERTASCEDSQTEYLIISSLSVSSTMSFFDQISFQSYYMHHITGNYLLSS